MIGAVFCTSSLCISAYSLEAPLCISSDDYLYKRSGNAKSKEMKNLFPVFSTKVNFYLICMCNMRILLISLTLILRVFNNHHFQLFWSFSYIISLLLVPLISSSIVLETLAFFFLFIQQYLLINNHILVCSLMLWNSNYSNIVFKTWEHYKG